MKRYSIFTALVCFLLFIAVYGQDSTAVDSAGASTGADSMVVRYLKAKPKDLKNHRIKKEINRLKQNKAGEETISTLREIKRILQEKKATRDSLKKSMKEKPGE